MTRTFLIAAIVVLIAGSAAAQDAAAPRFLIERIEVRNNKRVTSQIILAESLLREGAEYSEADLRDAAARLNRLPFLLGAEFALERGSERGKHVLVITVAETKWFFYHLDIVPIFEQNDSDNTFAVGGGGAATLDRSSSALALGARFFVGRRGAIHAGLFGERDNRDYTVDDIAATVGYTQYDIFDTRAFATVNVKNSFGKFAPQVVVGVPLSLNQTLTLEYDVTRTNTSTVKFATGDFHSGQSQRLATLRWVHNTTDRPFLPTRGTVLHVTPVVVSRDERRLTYTSVEGVFVPSPLVTHTSAYGVDLGAARYWPLSDRNSVCGRIETGFANVEHRVNGASGQHQSSYAIAEGCFSRSLWDRERVNRQGDSRLELNVSVAQRWRPEDRYDDEGNVQVMGAWVRRNSWGLFRLGVGLAW